MSIPNYNYGLDKELADKAKALYDPVREKQAQTWIESIVNEKFPSTFQESLKDGVLLCKLAKITVPAANVKFTTSKMPFKQMENINEFLRVMTFVDVPKTDQFQTVDLFEGKNMNQVINGIFAFSRHCQKHGFKGELLGPKLADKHEVEFNDEQLIAGKTIIGGQMGYNGGATQAGMSHGGKREITQSK